MPRPFPIGPVTLCRCGCGEPVARRPGYWNRFRHGHHGSRPVLAPETRFWALVEKTEGCWLWRGTLDSKGYGRFRLGGRSFHRRHFVHRISYQLAHGPIPPELLVCHHCDRPACVRPDHLFLGTQADNIADRDAKGRKLIGEAAPKARLTEQDVTQIRARCAEGESRSELAREFGVAKVTVQAIVRRRNWRHMP
jgi:hypothetical protein